MGPHSPSVPSFKSIGWSKVLRESIFSAISGRNHFLYRRYSLCNESRVISFTPFSYTILPKYWAGGSHATVSLSSYRSATASALTCAWQPSCLNSHFSGSSWLNSGCSLYHHPNRMACSHDFYRYCGPMSISHFQRNWLRILLPHR